MGHSMWMRRKSQTQNTIQSSLHGLSSTPADTYLGSTATLQHTKDLRDIPELVHNVGRHGEEPEQPEESIPLVAGACRGKEVRIAISKNQAFDTDDSWDARDFEVAVSTKTVQPVTPSSPGPAGFECVTPKGYASDQELGQVPDLGNALSARSPTSQRQSPSPSTPKGRK